MALSNSSVDARSERSFADLGTAGTTVMRGTVGLLESCVGRGALRFASKADIRDVALH